MQTATSETAVKKRTVRRPASQRHYWILGVLSCLMAVMIFLDVTTDRTTFLRFMVHQIASGTVSDPQELRVGKIVLRTDADHCKRLSFDNNSGQITEESPCDTTMVGRHNAIPIPEGTARRLDEISKSFLAKTH